MPNPNDPQSYPQTATGALFGSAQFVWNGTTWVASAGGSPTGTAGTPNAAVTSVQGVASGTPVIVTGSGVAGTPATGVVSVQGITNGTPQPVVLTAGTAQVGLVTAGGFTALQTATPTVQAAAYAAGNVVGGLITLSNAARVAAGSGLIQSVAASFVSGVVPSLDIIFFNANPTASTITDKTALAVVTADLGKIIGIAHLTDSTLVGASAPSYIQSGQNAMPFSVPSGTAIYAAVVTRTAATLTSTSDMILSARILQD